MNEYVKKISDEYLVGEFLVEHLNQFLKEWTDRG